MRATQKFVTMSSSCQCDGSKKRAGVTGDAHAAHQVVMITYPVPRCHDPPRSYADGHVVSSTSLQEVLRARNIEKTRLHEAVLVRSGSRGVLVDVLAAMCPDCHARHRTTHEVVHLDGRSLGARVRSTSWGAGKLHKIQPIRPSWVLCGWAVYDWEILSGRSSHR